MAGREVVWNVDTLAKAGIDSNDWNHLNAFMKKNLMLLVTNQPYLSHLHFENVNMTDNMVSQLARLLNTNTSVIIIDLNNNFIGDNGAKSLAATLLVNRKIYQLNLARNAIQDEGVKEIFKSLRRNTSLRKLDLTGNLITDAVANDIGYTLSFNSTLTTLKIGRNPLTNVGVRRLLGGLRNRNQLRNLELTAINMGDEGAKEIARILLTNDTLYSIGLSQCGITDEGAKAIAAALYVNDKLGNLFLKGNLLGDDSVIAFTNVLLLNKYLDILVLNDNSRITDVSIDPILNLLQHNSTLTYLSLTTAGFSDAGKDRLTQALSGYIDYRLVIQRGSAEMARVALRNADPWTEENHTYIGKEFRRQIFELLGVYQSLGLEEVDSLAYLPWHDLRHVIRAWGILRVRKAMGDE